MDEFFSWLYIVSLCRPFIMLSKLFRDELVSWMYYHKLPVEERCFPYNKHLLGSLTLKIVGNLPFKVSFKLVADNILKHFFILFRENKAWYFMWIVCLLVVPISMFYMFYKCAKVSIDPIAFFNNLVQYTALPTSWHHHCLYWSFMVQSTHLGHVDNGQFTGQA